MAKNRRRQSARSRQAHHGRVSERSEISLEIDAERYDWEQGEDKFWAAQCFLSSQGLVLMSPELILGVQEMAEMSGTGDERLAGCGHRRSAFVRDGDEWRVIAGGGDSEEEAEEALRYGMAAWLAERIGRAGMLGLALAWINDGPMAFFGPSYADGGGVPSRRSARQSFDDWQEAYFAGGRSITFEAGDR